MPKLNAEEEASNATPQERKESFEEFRQRVEAEEDKAMDNLSARAAEFHRKRNEAKLRAEQTPPADGQQSA